MSKKLKPFLSYVHKNRENEMRVAVMEVIVGKKSLVRVRMT